MSDKVLDDLRKLQRACCDAWLVEESTSIDHEAIATAAADEIERLQREHRNRGAAAVLAKEYFAEKDREIERLRAALHEIAHSKYCSYENTGQGQYGIGVTDGHRYCAHIAKEALKGDKDE